MWHGKWWEASWGWHYKEDTWELYRKRDWTWKRKPHPPPHFVVDWLQSCLQKTDPRLSNIRKENNKKERKCIITYESNFVWIGFLGKVLWAGGGKCNSARIAPRPPNPWHGILYLGRRRRKWMQDQHGQFRKYNSLNPKSGHLEWSVSTESYSRALWGLWPLWYSHNLSSSHCDTRKCTLGASGSVKQIVLGM